MELLPIGSIVLLDDIEQKVIIVGRCVSTKKDDNYEVFDYCGCLYPKGISNQDDLFVFESKNIQKVIFVGYEDKDEKERSELIKSVDNIYKNIMADSET